MPAVSSLKWSPTKLEKEDLNRMFHDQVRQEVDKIAELNPLENAPVLSAVAASQWPQGQKGYDTRPRFFDPLSQKFCLVDTGSAICAVAAGPEDVPNPDLALVAANGTLIECCGYKEMEVQIGRKRYKFKAAIAKVQDTIIGWDFFRKYKLSFWWSDLGDCYLHDRQAKVKKVLEYITIPHQSRPHLRSVESVSFSETENASLMFDTAAMARCDLADTFSPTQVSDNLEIPEFYQTLINRFPNLLKTSFTATSNGQKVIHYIDTGQAPPCSARLRPLMKGSPKEVKGKEAWMELVDFGIVEPVDVSKPTLWTSALHLQPKKCGGMRPCGDFRQLNARTQLDKYPLPHLQKFTHKLHGSRIFTKLDIKKAYHHVEIAKNHRHKTAVLTPWGCYQFKKMAIRCVMLLFYSEFIILPILCPLPSR